jgi:hypothetical protein
MDIKRATGTVIPSFNYFLFLTFSVYNNNLSLLLVVQIIVSYDGWLITRKGCVSEFGLM